MVSEITEGRLFVQQVIQRMTSKLTNLAVSLLQAGSSSQWEYTFYRMLYKLTPVSFKYALLSVLRKLT